MQAIRSPRKPPNICPSCWNGPVRAQYGLLGDPLECRAAPEDPSPTWSGGYAYSVSPAALLFRACFGCVWCGFLIRYFRAQTYKDLEWPTSRGPLQIRVGSMDYADELRDESYCAVIFTIVVNGWHDSPPYVYTTADDPAAAWIRGRARIVDMGSPRALRMAKACVDQCVRDHPRCREPSIYASDSSPLPTRLIDCTNPNRPRIIRTTPSMRGVYVALSYVWGSPQPHRTTLANLGVYTRDGINLAGLPQTICDAIHVTRALGVSFLWIDSLCIVQDSQEDKNHELKGMRDVYRHAYCTIDAASARAVSEGFLQDRRPLAPVATLPFVCPQSSLKPPRIGTLYLTGVGADGIQDHRDIWTTIEPGTSHTRQRAWCLQETLLSRRSLIYAAETLQLRCQTCTQNVGGAMIDDHPSSEPHRLPDSVFHSGSQAVHGTQAWADVRRAWCEIIRDYSARDVSYATDKFTACAGLAELFAPALGADYLAGLWRDELLLHSLMWWRHNSLQRMPKARRATPYRAPSWSWASLDDAVSWHEDSWTTATERERLAEVVSCTVVLKDKSLPFGEVTGGSVVLRAPIFSCERHPEYDRYLRLTRASATNAHQSCETDCTSSTSIGHFEAVMDTEDDATVQELWIVPFWRGPSIYTGPVIETAGLVLAREYGLADRECSGADARRTVYRRVGMFFSSPVSELGWEGEMPHAVEIEVV
ncbi:heterokaryon incompatibility protein-domain-containing protein [Cubamyces lactineus]|nr:heterokaryon incompatibility protein-domain-containing protein [Cubamyces lactineus]